MHTAPRTHVLIHPHAMPGARTARARRKLSRTPPHLPSNARCRRPHGQRRRGDCKQQGDSSHLNHVRHVLFCAHVLFFSFLGHAPCWPKKRGHTNRQIEISTPKNDTKDPENLWFHTAGWRRKVHLTACCKFSGGISFISPVLEKEMGKRLHLTNILFEIRISNCEIQRGGLF